MKHVLVILAFNHHALTERNIRHIVESGLREDLFVFDNGSEPSFEGLCAELGVRYHREEENLLVNPAWNKIIERESCDYMTLLNNDCFVLSKNYYRDVIRHMADNKIGISSCKTKNVHRLKEGALSLSRYFRLRIPGVSLRPHLRPRRQGWLMTLNYKMFKELDYKIPDYLSIWYGDDWIWGQFIRAGIKTAVYKNRYAVHVKSSTTSSAWVRELINKDVANIEEHGEWHRELTTELHRRSGLFSKYV